MSKAFRENYKQIDWGPLREWRRTERKQEGPSGPFYFMPDIKEFVSPINHERITSRPQLEEHNKRHGVRQCGELKTPQDFDNGSRRNETFNEKRFGDAFKRALEKTNGV